MLSTKIAKDATNETPAAPPSMLSIKLSALLTPTIQNILMPTLTRLFALILTENPFCTSKIETIIEVPNWTNNLKDADRFLMSSHKPTIAIIKLGIIKISNL
jgi:hypothetical protein